MISGALVSAMLWTILADARPYEIPKSAKQYVTEVNKSVHQYEFNLGGTLDEFNTADFLDTYNFNKRLKSKFQPNQFLMIENLGQTDVVNPRIVVNGRRYWFSVETILASVLRPGMTDAEKAIAIWVFCSSIEVQCHDNNRRVGPLYPDDKSQPSRNGFQERGNPVKAVNSYYCSGCQYSATNLVVLLRHAGLTARAVWICPLGQYECHCVAEVWYDGGWHLFDPERRSFYLNGDNRTIASYAALHKKPGLAARTHDGGFAAKYRAMRSHAKEYEMNYPPSVMPVDPDWVDTMSMTLRPGEKFIWLWNDVDKFLLGLNPRNKNNRPYRLANGKMIYRPNLRDANFRTGILSEENIKTTVEDGRKPSIHSDIPGATSFVSYKVKTPYPIVGGIVGGRFYRKSKSDICQIYISVNNNDWTKVASVDTTGEIEKYLSVDNFLPTKNGGPIYECYLKYEFSAAADPEDVGIDQVYLEFDVQMSEAGLPSLSVGKNRVSYKDDTRKPDNLRISHGWKESSATKLPVAPSEAIVPKDNAKVKTVDQLAWTEAVDPDGKRIDNYHLQLSPREDMLHPLSPNFDRLTFSGKPEWEVPQGWFVAGQTYYWRVRAKDRWGAWSGWSPVWNFTIKP
jgi:Transglutaminase-like superfamily